MPTLYLRAGGPQAEISPALSSTVAFQQVLQPAQDRRGQHRLDQAVMRISASPSRLVRPGWSRIARKMTIEQPRTAGPIFNLPEPVGPELTAHRLHNSADAGDQQLPADHHGDHPGVSQPVAVGCRPGSRKMNAPHTSTLSTSGSKTRPSAGRPMPAGQVAVEPVGDGGHDERRPGPPPCSTAISCEEHRTEHRG